MQKNQSHQHAQIAGRDNIAPAMGFHGTLVGGQTANTARPNVARARYSNFADYKPPKRRKKDNPDKELCGVDECNAFPSKKHYPWCAGHARSKGLIQ